MNAPAQQVFRHLLSLFVLLLSGALALAAPLQAREIYPTRKILKGHTKSVLVVAFTPDGKGLISGSRDETIKLWDLKTGEVVRTLTPHQKKGVPGDVYAICFSPDGKLMATGGRDLAILIWNTDTYEVIRKMEGHTSDIRDMRFSPDGKTLASVAADNTLRLWDVATGKQKASRSEHTKRVKTVDYSPDGMTIITASSDATVRLWDAATAEPRSVIKGAESGLEFCRISPDGKQLFGGTGNLGELMFWDAHTGKLLKALPDAHGNQNGRETDCGLYSPNGRWALSGSKDRSIRFWDPRTYELVYSISGVPGRVESMAISADGKTLVTGFGGTDSTISIWDLSTLGN